MYEHADDASSWWNQPPTMKIWQLLLLGLLCFGLGNLSAGQGDGGTQGDLSTSRSGSPFPSREAVPTVTSVEIRASASRTLTLRAEPAPLATSETVGTTAVVPEVVGLSLASAQDALKAAGFDRVVVYDSLRQGRNQILDTNWVVVSQTPAGGLSAPSDTLIELSAKKIGE